MKKLSLSSVLICAFGLTVLAACGGGGGGGGGDVTVTQPTTAVLTLSTTGAIPANTTINSYSVTITLPAGVTVKSTVPPATDTNVVTASGKAAGASISGVYTAATSTLPGTVKVYIASGPGFDAGEFCKVNADIAAGHYPTASSFAQPTLDDATGYDSSTSSTVLNMQILMSLTATVVIN